MIKIKEVQIDSYKLYKDTKLDLDNIKGLVTVEGKNNDIANFSSNSVGKTTFVSSILQGFYGKNLLGESIEKVTNLYTGDKPSVTITFEVNDIEYVVKNNYQTNELKLFKQGHLVEFTRKNDTFKEIESILGVSHFLMSHLIYISPSSKSLFSSAENTIQSKFIQQLLSLEFIGDINKKVSADLKSYRGELNLKLKELTIAQNQVDNLNKQLDLVPEIEIKDYDSEIRDYVDRIADLEEQHKSSKKLYTSDKEARDKLNTEHIELKAELRHLEKKQKEELDLIEGGQCPTCKQDTSNIEIETDINEIKKNKRFISQIEDELIVAKASVKESEESVTNLNSDIIKAKNELKRLEKDKLAQTKQQSSEEVRNKIIAQIAEAITELSEVQESLQDLEKKVYILELVAECSSPKGFVKERIALFLKLYNIELQKLARSLLGNEYKVSIVKQGSGHYSLELEDSEITLSYNSLSSGFKSRMDIILTLALNKAVETLTGISINILVLDEILSAVDESGIESIEKLLLKIQNMFGEKIIFLVSHNQYLRGSDKTLVVERDSGCSKLKWL